MTPLQKTLAVMMVIAGVLLAAGCVQPQTDAGNQTITATQTAQQSKPLYKVTIPQVNDSHADYIKMEADVYNVGEVVEYYLINEGPEPLTCSDTPPAFIIYRHIENDTWKIVPEAAETMAPLFSHLKSGEQTRVRRFVTTNWAPGLYRIDSDCNISRDFVLREVPKVTPV